MIDCMIKKICELIGLLGEKLNQLLEVEAQQEATCEKLDVILNPEADCTCPITEHVWRFNAFDSANLFDAAFIHQTTVNGVDVDTPRDAAWTEKEQHYQGTVDQVNATSAGMSMTLIQGQPITENSLAPTYEVRVPAGETLTIVNRHTGVVREFGTNEDGTCYSTFQDAAGNDIGSNAAIEQ